MKKHNKSPDFSTKVIKNPVPEKKLKLALNQKTKLKPKIKLIFIKIKKYEIFPKKIIIKINFKKNLEKKLPLPEEGTIIIKNYSFPFILLHKNCKNTIIGSKIKGRLYKNNKNKNKSKIFTEFLPSVRNADILN